METTPGIDYQAVLADLRKKREDLDKAIAGIEQILGLPSSANGGGDSLSATATVSIPPRDAQIREDTFFGMNIAAASQKFLEIRKKPATSIEIANALTAGGLTSSSDQLHKTVNTVLHRNSGLFVKVKRGTWGLRIWYPNFRAPKDGDKDDE